MSRPQFKGNPALYKRIAVVGTLFLLLLIYGTTALIQLLVHDISTLLHWKPVGLAMIVAILYGRFSYKSMMMLDAQYGSGRSWELQTTTVKLPHFKEKRLVTEEKNTEETMEVELN